MSPAHTQPKRRKRVAVLVAGLVAAGGVAWAATAFAATGDAAAVGQIACPTPNIGAVPAAAQDEVNRELAGLDKQIAEANTRLANTAGQGGPNFVQNAILGPLADKRAAALDRIAIAIDRVGGVRPQGLEQFATCTVANDGAAPPPQVTETEDPAEQPAEQPEAPPAVAGQIVCPTPELGEVPAAAQDEVNRELAGLDKQIAEANTRLANTAGQGGPNFVQNAILGPLADKRAAGLERIAIAIDRVGGDRPQGLEQFATCTVG